MTRQIDIILPVYREEENLTRVINAITKYVKTKHRILAIWQDQKDPSVAILKDLKKKYKNLEVIQSRKGVGLLHAIKTGIQHVKADIIVIMMSDYSDNPKDVDKMIRLLEDDYDIVCGARYMKGGRRIGGSKMKAFLSWATCISLYYITGLPTRDGTNAFKAFKKEILRKIKFESKNGFELPLELVVKSHRLKFRIGEIPTIWRERGKGYSKFKILDLSPFYIRWYKYAIKTRFKI